MAAIKKTELEKLEEKYHLDPGELTYQERCSRITAYEKGEEWNPEKKKEKKRMWTTNNNENPLYGKRLLISPLMTPDAHRNVYYEEIVGHEIVTQEANAAERIHGAGEDIQHIVSDYDIVYEDKSRPVYAKTTLPKIGTEITWCIGKELVPVVRGNDGQRGYIWSFPTKMLPVVLDDGREFRVQVYGLKAIIQTIYPELLKEFSGKPMMSYIDGFTLAASIPLTNALLKEHRRKELLEARAGLA